MPYKLFVLEVRAHAVVEYLDQAQAELEFDNNIKFAYGDARGSRLVACHLYGPDGWINSWVRP